MSFLPLGAGVEMRNTKRVLNVAQQKAVEARNLARRRTEISEGRNVEQRVFDNPDLRAIFLGRREIERTLPPIIRGGKEYRDPKDPGQAGLYQGGLFGQIKDIETREKQGFDTDATLMRVIENSYSEYRPEDFEKNIEAGKSFYELNLDPDTKDGDEIQIDDLDALVSDDNIIADLDREDEYEDIGNNRYRYTTNITTLHKISDWSKYDVVREKTYGPFEHDYINGEIDFDAHDEDEDYYPEIKYFLKLKKVSSGRYYGRAK